MFNKIIEKAIKYYAAGDFAQQFQEARDCYFKITGKVFDDDPLFNQRQESFIDWYLLDRPLNDSGYLPIKQYLSSFAKELTAEEIEQGRALLASRHSIFQVRSIFSKGFKLKDLLKKQKFKISERRNLVGLKRGDIIESRVIPWKDIYLLSENVIHHPRNAKKEILAMLKKIRKEKSFANESELLLQLQKLKNKAMQFNQLATARIYNIDQLQSEQENC